MRKIIFVSICVIQLHVHAGAQDLGEKLKALIDKSKIPKDHIAIVVGDPTKSEPLWQLNPDKKLIPASLTKIATSAAILEKFSPSHQLVTEFVASQKPVGRALKGDLFLKGDGDPGFVSESMWFLVNELLRSGIEVVEGNLVVDDTKFDEVRFDSSRDSVRVDRAYDSPIGGMSFNWSAANIFIRPGDKVGDPAKVYSDPDCDYIEIRNHAKTVSGKKNSLEVTRIDGVKALKGKEVIRISGSVGLEAKESIFYKAVKDPTLFAGHQARCFLKQRGVNVQGTVIKGKAPAQSVQLGAIKSKPISSIVTDLMKFSNNYVAEMMTKNLAAEFKGRPAKMEDGVQVIRDYLGAQGLTDFELLNPSGLSRKNKFKAIHFYEVLKKTHASFGLYPEFLASLPIGGVDGTLKNRLNGLDEKVHVRAKTGQLSGVIGLAGFIGRDDGEQFAFVFLYNGDNSTMFKAKDLFDQLTIAISNR